MFDLIAFAVAIALVVVTLQLRALLAKPFPVIRAQVVKAAAPAGAADLYDAAHAQLVALGFEGPSWVLTQSEPPEANSIPLRAAYRHPAERALVWVCPPINTLTPHTLLVYWTTRLEDGRLLISQAFDPYYAALADERLIAQTIGEESLTAQWQAHRAWCDLHARGAARRPADDAEMVAVCADETNAHRERLLASGRLALDREGVARPGFALAVHLLRHFWRRPKPKVSTLPLSPQRLAILAGVVERARHNEPTRGAQWLLFIASVALFVAFGWIFWDLSFAAILLAVIAFHESGHFLAMRAFGYRNVHMLALPLVGGVTIGVDASPDAAKRAWMSLMGPLPGIVVGWVLLALHYQASPQEPAAAAWVSQAALVCLFVNYLNVLPIPPLDGGHVMQAMLPPRWLNLQAWLVLAACLVGGIAAWFADLTLLAVLAALQFFGALKMFRVGRAVRLLLRDEKALAGRSRPMRVLDALTALETVAGPARVARERINQALQALQVIDTKPMGGMQRGVVGIVYGALLVVPLAAIVLGAAIMHPLGAEDRAKIESLRAAQKELRARVHEVSFEQLLSDIAEGAATGGADDKQLAAAEARIGRPLPEDLHRLYRKQNGVSRLTIAPVENLALADESDRKHLGAIAEDGTISLFDADPLAKAAPERVPLARTREWLRLGGERDSESATYLDAGAGDSARVIVCFGACTSYRSLRAWLEEVWVSAMAARRKP